MKNRKSKSNMRVLVFDQENGTVNAELGVGIEADSIECESGIYHLSDATRYVDEWNGHIYYIYNASIPEKVEASKLKQLRRSSALNRIFEFDRSKPLDIFKLMPYVVIIALIIFGGR